MTTEVTRFDLENDMDVVLAHRRAMQLARFSGAGIAEQTRFATAVSEICRNCIEFARNGAISFSVLKEAETYFLNAFIEDRGNGITDLDRILKRDPQHFKGRGIGIVFARKLSERFRIETGSKGTRVWIDRQFSPKVPINSIILKGWAQQLRNTGSVSHYEELKERNMQLLELTEELREQKLKAEAQTEEIRLLNGRLEQSNENMKQFTYAISHDLKTPLTNLHMALSLASEMDIPEEVHAYLQIISRSSKRLDKTVHSLIEILDMQSSRTGVARGLDLASVFQDVLEDFSEGLQHLNANVQYNFDACVRVNYVEAYMKSLFSNLVSNAIKYSHSGRDLVINVSCRKEDEFVVIEFQDNGRGIDLQKHGGRLFHPFSRFAPDVEGKGIGLFLIKNMIERNGGKVKVEGKLDEGMKFIFYLVEF